MHVYASSYRSWIKAFSENGRKLQNTIYSATTRQSWPIGSQEKNKTFQESYLSIIIEINNTDRNQPIATHSPDLLNPLKKVHVSSEVC